MRVVIEPFSKNVPDLNGFIGKFLNFQKQGNYYVIQTILESRERWKTLKYFLKAQ